VISSGLMPLHGGTESFESTLQRITRMPASRVASALGVSTAPKGGRNTVGGCPITFSITAVQAATSPGGGKGECP
jgi:hypothetical protein